MRTAKSCGSGAAVLALRPREATLLRDNGGKRAVLRGEHEVSRKAIAQGRPECFALPCMLVCRFVCANRTRDRGCSKHPVFPAPSNFGGPMKMQSSGAMRREIAASYSVVVTREGGCPSIPEALVIEPISRGVLDPPPSRGTTTWFLAVLRGLRSRVTPDNPRQHAPAEQRRFRRRRQLRRPARHFFQRVGIHHHPAPDALDPRQRLPPRRGEIPQRQAIIRLARDIEAGVIL